MGYGAAFAGVYDTFMPDAEYEKRTAYIAGLLARARIRDGIVLDLGCGTGAVTAGLIGRGYDLIGVDLSADMLAAAKERLKAEGLAALLLCQDMRELDLYGTVRATVSTMDCVNHITDRRDLLRVFRKVSLFTEPGGVFIFDANTTYKHREILADETFVLEDDDHLLVWQNFSDRKTDRVDMLLDLFTRCPDGRYLRQTDEITERAYPIETLTDMLKKAGFDTVQVYDDLKLTPPRDTSERICFVAKKAGGKP
ncbi:MAG: methyltransferase domain-containing protein [Clostridia bacterium]|nr:methyltransferase domain-containing protein [Clostridia bacterium]